jgi:hypothetical protein
LAEAGIGGGRLFENEGDSALLVANVRDKNFGAPDYVLLAFRGRGRVDADEIGDGVADDKIVEGGV